jgi:hypothetical protein
MSTDITEPKFLPNTHPLPPNTCLKSMDKSLLNLGIIIDGSGYNWYNNRAYKAGSGRGAYIKADMPCRNIDKTTVIFEYLQLSPDIAHEQAYALFMRTHVC